jgi:short-subunit dehydrogenase
MNNLFIGGSSEIALEIANSLQNTYNLSRKKNKVFKKNYTLKNYSEKQIVEKLNKMKKIKFDNILIFNGIFETSFLSNTNKKKLLNILNVNFIIPLEISRICIREKIINKNGGIYFISSIAALKPKIGNAGYAISKNALNFACKILCLEQKKRFIRVNTIMFGLIKNRMGHQVLNSIPLIQKKKINFSKIKEIKSKIKKILRNKSNNGKIIKV